MSIAKIDHDDNPRDLFMQTYRVLQHKIRTSVMVSSTALVALLHAYTPALAQDKSSQDAIADIISEYEKREFSTQKPNDRSDAIANLLKRTDAVGAQEFIEKNYVKTDMHKPLVDQPDVMRCLVHNAFREARGAKDLEEGGPEMVALVSIARAVDPKGRFPKNDVCAVVKQAKQFSWTFDKRILSQTPTREMQDAYLAMEQRLMAAVGSMTPIQFLHAIAKKLDVPEDSLFYHHEKMWGEDELGNVIYGRRPERREYVSEEQYKRHAEHYKMSPKTARFFAGLVRVTPAGKSIGAHIVLRSKRSDEK